MTLSIRWKVTIGTLLVLACGLLIARTLAIRSLEQQEIVQSGQILEARTSLVAYGLQPFLTQPGALSSTPQLQAAVRDLSTRALARVTVIAPDGRVLADSAVSDHLLATLENHRTRPEDSASRCHRARNGSLRRVTPPVSARCIWPSV